MSSRAASNTTKTGPKPHRCQLCWYKNGGKLIEPNSDIQFDRYLAYVWYSGRLLKQTIQQGRSRSTDRRRTLWGARCDE